MDAFSSSINQEMFEYIMYSRLAFADISGFNPNVFSEVRAAPEPYGSGSAIVTRCIKRRCFGQV